MTEKKRANELALDYIQSELTRTGAAKGDLAKAMNISASALSKILTKQRQIDLGELFLAQRFFQSPPEIEIQLVQSLFPDRKIKLNRETDRPRLTDQQALAAARRLSTMELDETGPEVKGIRNPRDVDIFHTTPGNDKSFIVGPQVMGLKLRPPTILLARKIAAIYMVGASASPRYNDGELIIFDVERSPAIAEYVIIEGHPVNASGMRSAYVGRLVERNGTDVSIDLISSRMTLHFPTGEFSAIRRIIPLDELLP
jgi:transcriptional regulator with XRE-family HTH domain